MDVVDAEGPVLAGDSKASRLWRSIWRTHFYAGVFAAPILVLMAVTGLVILYTEPIQSATHGELIDVTADGSPVALEDQRDAVTDAYPDHVLVSVTPPENDRMSSKFTLTEPDGTAVDVFVDPYTGDVLGDQKTDNDVVGLANRLHGNLDNESITVPFPALSGILGDGPAFASVALGDLVIEIFAGWALVLAFTGAYLWWPRKAGTGKALFMPRIRKPGRARWRDLHAVGGTLLAFLLVFFLTTGLPWSAAWGANWSYVASEITPNKETSFWDWDGPASAIPVTGDLDRAGHRIPWAAGTDEIPPSGGGGGHHDDGDGSSSGTTAGPPATPASLDMVVAAARDEGMERGYSIDLPVDVLDDPDEPVYGSYVVTNPWPSRMHDQGALYLDQFSGKTLARSTPKTWGKLQWLTEYGIQTHMGTQYGLFTRILMTTGCLLVLWNVTTAVIMWNRRRRKGTVGLPRRPVDVRIQRVLGITALVLAVVYPAWGLTLIAVLLADRYIVRRTPRLRTAFGMR